eukprot:364358-Chlamydomonas_euryale.AAC.18
MPAGALACDRRVLYFFQSSGLVLRVSSCVADGGIDDNNAVYWADNMFTPNAWGAYCSEVSPNVNTLAVLQVCGGGGLEQVSGAVGRGGWREGWDAGGQDGRTAGV